MPSRRDVVAFVAIAVVVGGVAAAFGAISMIDVVQASKRVVSNGPIVGEPVDWELNFQWPHADLQRGLYNFHNFLLGIDLAICSLVATLLLFVAWRYRATRNPVPSTVTHNTVLEVFWTVAPVLVLVAISIPSFRLLDLVNIPPPAGLVLKVTGHQWYWEYAYPQNGGVDISSLIVPEDKLPPTQPGQRLLAVDNDAVVPVDTDILVQITGADVIHSFMVPSIGVQKYAIPGRLNETWTRIEREGVYYGQCSQICGVNHAFMPIAIRVVSKQAFRDWIEKERGQTSSRGDTREASARQTAEGRP